MNFGARRVIAHSRTVLLLVLLVLLRLLLLKLLLLQNMVTKFLLNLLRVRDESSKTTAE